MIGRGSALALLCSLALAGCQSGPAGEGRGDAGVRPKPTPRPTPPPLVLEEGTTLVMRLETGVSTASASAGDLVVARLIEPVRQGERVVVPEDAEVRGEVMIAVRSGKAKGRARLVVAFEQLTVKGGPHPIEASPIDITAGDSHKRDAAIIGGSAGAGAIIGGIKDGGKGAGIGALIGGAAGTGVVLVTRGKEVELPAGTQVKVTLRRSVSIPR